MENRKRKITLTESDIHFLVENAVREIIKENGMEEDAWGGIKNAFQGIRKGNWNLSNTYGAGNLASSFNNYYEKAKEGLQGMEKIAGKYDKGGQLSTNLANANKMIATVANSFNMQAKRVALDKNQNNMNVVNPWQQQRQQAANAQANTEKQMATNYENSLNQRVAAERNNYNNLNNRFSKFLQSDPKIQQQYSAWKNQQGKKQQGNTAKTVQMNPNQGKAANQ
jgi:hypothetical protein